MAADHFDFGCDLTRTRSTRPPSGRASATTRASPSRAGRTSSAIVALELFAERHPEVDIHLFGDVAPGGCRSAAIDHGSADAGPAQRPLQPLRRGARALGHERLARPARDAGRRLPPRRQRRRAQPDRARQRRGGLRAGDAVRARRRALPRSSSGRLPSGSPPPRPQRAACRAAPGRRPRSRWSRPCAPSSAARADRARGLTELADRPRAAALGGPAAADPRQHQDAGAGRGQCEHERQRGDLEIDAAVDHAALGAPELLEADLIAAADALSPADRASGSRAPHDGSVGQPLGGPGSRRLGGDLEDRHRRIHADVEPVLLGRLEDVAGAPLGAGLLDRTRPVARERGGELDPVDGMPTRSAIASRTGALLIRLPTSSARLVTDSMSNPCAETSSTTERGVSTRTPGRGRRGLEPSRLGARREERDLLHAPEGREERDRDAYQQAEAVVPELSQTHSESHGAHPTLPRARGFCAEGGTAPGVVRAMTLSTSEQPSAPLVLARALAAAAEHRSAGRSQSGRAASTDRSSTPIPATPRRSTA